MAPSEAMKPFQASGERPGSIEEFFSALAVPRSSSRDKGPGRPTPASEDLEVDWYGPPRRLEINGAVHHFYTIGQLARAINRRPVTIRSWEDKDIIPRTTFRDKNGRRLYSWHQVEGLRALCKRHGMLDLVRARGGPRIPLAFTEEALCLWRSPFGEDRLT